MWENRAEAAAPWVSRFIALLGLISVGSAVAPPIRSRVHLLTDVLPAFAPAVAAAATAGVGLAMLLVSGALRRRKYRAWVLATILSASLVALHILKGLDVEEASLSLLALILLLVTRPAFSGRPDPRSGRRVVWIFLVSTTVATALGSFAILLDPDSLKGPVTFFTVLKQVWLGFVGVEGPLRYGEAAVRLPATLLLLGLTVAALTVATALRPAGGPHPIRHDEEAKVRELLEAHGGRDSLGYFSLRDDKSVIFSPTGKSAISYRVLNGVSLVAADPIGDNEAWPGAIQAWLEEARRYAWVPAVLGASELGAKAFAREGFDALELGDEAVVMVESFSLEGRPMRGVRQAVGKLQRKGYTTQIVRQGALDDAALDELKARADRWRDGTVERGFSMALGRLGDQRDCDLLFVTCTDGDGEPCGLLGFVPWGKDGVSLDVMRRARDSDNGVIELMVCSLMAAAPELGVKRVSLNFAMFRAVLERGGKLGAGPVLRLWYRALLAASQVWQIDSLYRSNAKYLPEWAPRYLCFESARDLPRVGIAAMEAEAFLVRPRWLGGRPVENEPDDAQPGDAHLSTAP